MRVVLHVSVPQELAEQLDAACEAVQQTRSAAIRAALAHVLASPDLWPVLVPHRTVENRSAAQILAWERDKARLEALPPGLLLDTSVTPGNDR